MHLLLGHAPEKDEPHCSLNVKRMHASFSSGGAEARFLMIIFVIELTVVAKELITKVTRRKSQLINENERSLRQNEKHELKKIFLHFTVATIYQVSE